MRNQTFSISILAVFLFVGASAHAQPDDYFKISNIVSTVEEVTEESSDLELLRVQSYFNNLNVLGLDATVAGNKEGGGSELQIILDALFKAWEIVEKNKPVVTIDNKFATALPEIAKQGWEKLTGWKQERSFKFHTLYQNGFKMNVVDFTYQVKLVYGGSVNGKGLYIASARVLPLKIDVLWGYTLDVKVNVPSVLNIGSEDNPLAAIQLDVAYSVKTVLKQESLSQSYQLQGDGLMQDLNSGKVIFNPHPACLSVFSKPNQAQ